VCPECGYSVFRITSGRCPECGDAFPSPVRPRRWAILRAPWEQRRRTSIPGAYVRTLLLIVFRPGRVGFRLGKPDRLGRALRWAAVHVALAALLGPALFWYQLPTRVAGAAAGRVPASRAFLPPQADTVPAATIALWATQSFVAWFAVLAFLPVLGAALAGSALAAWPAAPAGVIKWGLYLTALPPMLLFTFGVLRGISYAFGLSRPAWMPSPAPLLGPTGLALVYAIWWGLGAAWNPYLPRRGCIVAYGLCGLFLLAWMLCAYALFDSGELRTLL
jgi:hypothetical protein